MITLQIQKDQRIQRRNEILPPKIHPEIYLNYVKAKTENIEKAKCGGRMDITDKRAEGVRVVFPSQAV